MTFTRRSLLSVTFAAGLAGLSSPALAQAPKEIRIDFATYNPVSLVLKEKGLLEKAFEKDGIAIRWVQTLGSNKALEFLNAASIDFGSTAGSAAAPPRRAPDQEHCAIPAQAGRARWPDRSHQRHRTGCLPRQVSRGEP